MSNRSIDPQLAVALVELAPAHPARANGRRYAVVMLDQGYITFTRQADARALIEREHLTEVSLFELRTMNNDL